MSGIAAPHEFMDRDEAAQNPLPLESQSLPPTL